MVNKDFQIFEENATAPAGFTIEDAIFPARSRLNLCPLSVGLAPSSDGASYLPMLDGTKASAPTFGTRWSFATRKSPLVASRNFTGVP